MRASFEHALVALDLLGDPSPFGAGLAPWLTHLGVRRLTLMHVAEVDYPRVGAVAGLEDHRARLLVQAEVLEGDFDPVRTRVEVGKPSEVLPQALEEEGADLLVVGNRRHGHLWDLLTGGGHWEILRRSTAPVLVLPLDPHAPPLAAPHKGSPLAALTDFSETADRALDLAARIARDTGAPLCLVHALEGRELDGPTRAALEERAERARGAGAPAVTTLALLGPASAVDGDVEAALVVLGTRGQGKLRSLLLGSVARDLLAATRLPAILLPACSRGGRAERGAGRAPKAGR